MVYMPSERIQKMNHAVAMPKCTTGSYHAQAMRGRKPIGPKGPYSNRVLELRSARGWTQAQVAERVGGSVQGPYIGRLEKGEFKVSDQMLENLCAAFNCKPWEVIPEKFGLTNSDIKALSIARELERDPDRQQRWLSSGEDAVSAILSSQEPPVPQKQ
jgi:transcriptional regulator with XRE-family HTH domain